MEEHFCDGAPPLWEEHSRVPCFHVLSRCSMKASSDSLSHCQHHHHQQQEEQHHYTPTNRRQWRHPPPSSRQSPSPHPHDHLHHNHQHFHHHHELCSSTTSPPLSLTALESISVHRLLTLFVFLLSWTAVCAAPRRMGGNSIPLFELDREPTNILKPNSSHTKAAISFLEAIMKASSGPSSSEDGDNSEYLLQSPLSSSSSSFSPSTSSSTSATTSATTTKAKTGSEPDVVLNSEIFPPPDSMMLPGLGSNPGYFSQRVAFSVERPETPPWPDFTFEQGFNEEGNSDDETAHSRRRRAVGDLQEVCKSTSHWGIKEWATDTFGQNVTILSKIMSAGNQELRQWFYETTCSRQHGVQQSCLGIDDNHYESVCLTKNAWVYAMIRTRRGEEGWSWIAISSSCNCAVRQRFVETTGHVDRVR